MSDSIRKEYNKINKLFKSYNSLYHKLALHCELSDSALDILYAIQWYEEPCTPSDIVDFCCCSKQTIHSSLKKMEKDGLLEINISPQNKKNRIVTLTEKGKMLATKTVTPIINAEINAFASLSPEERNALIAIQTKQLKAFQNETDRLLKGTEQK